jgi:hypothetical protein
MALMVLVAVAVWAGVSGFAAAQGAIDDKWVPGQRVASVVYNSQLPTGLQNRDVAPRFLVRLPNGAFVRGLLDNEGRAWCIATRSQAVTFRGVRVGTSRHLAQRRLGRRFTFTHSRNARSTLAFFDAPGGRLTTLYLTRDSRRVYAIQVVAASDADCYRD